MAQAACTGQANAFGATCSVRHDHDLALGLQNGA